MSETLRKQRDDARREVTGMRNAFLEYATGLEKYGKRYNHDTLLKVAGEIRNILRETTLDHRLGDN